MRILIISFVIAFMCLLPDMAQAENWILPGWFLSIVGIPHTGLGYLTVFFHEIGHAVTSWTYGQPAVPAFNFADGGGVSVPLMDRSLLLQAVPYLAIAYIAWLAWQDRNFPVILGLIAFSMVHGYFAFGERYLDAVSYMGHGGAVLAGCFCIWRAVTHQTEKAYGAGERYLNMIFGLFAVMDNILMSYNLINNDIVRTVYEAGIGGHLTNDFHAIAMRLNTDVQHVAVFSLAFTLTAFAATAYICWRCILNAKAADELHAAMAGAGTGLQMASRKSPSKS